MSIHHSDTSYPPPHIISPEAGQSQTHTIILLHGTSTSGPEFGDAFLSFAFPWPAAETISPTLESNSGLTTSQSKTTLPQLFPSIRWVFPTGKRRKVTVLKGEEKNAWFDMHSFTDRTLNEDSQVEGLSESVGYLGKLVKREVELLEGIHGLGRGGERVIFGGFSQGAAMSAFLLLSGELLRHDVKVKGWVCMSGWLPFRSQIQAVLDSPLPDYTFAGMEIQVWSMTVIEFVRKLLSFEKIGLIIKELNETEKGLLAENVLVTHGIQDQKVLLKWAEGMRDIFDGVGCDVRMDKCEVGHWWCEGTMQDFVDWVLGTWEIDVETNDGS